jgi:hypothetical protein
MGWLSEKTTMESIAFVETMRLFSMNGVGIIELTPLYGCASCDPAYDIPYPFTTRHFLFLTYGPQEFVVAVAGQSSK